MDVQTTFTPDNVSQTTSKSGLDNLFAFQLQFLRYPDTDHILISPVNGVYGGYAISITLL